MGKAFKLDNEVLTSSISSLQTSLNNHAGAQASGSAFGHVKTGTGIGVSGGVISVNYGTAAGTACQGNDSRLSNSRTPNAHASTSTNYGAGTASNYGHVKVSDNYTSSAGAAANSVAASSKAVYDAYTALKNSFQGGVDTIYNAFVNAGTTPSDRTPAAIQTAVTTLKNNSYSSGRTTGQNDVKNNPNSYSLYRYKTGEGSIQKINVQSTAEKNELKITLGFKPKIIFLNYMSYSTSFNITKFSYTSEETNVRTVIYFENANPDKIIYKTTTSSDTKLETAKLLDNLLGLKSIDNDGFTLSYKKVTGIKYKYFVYG